MVFHNPVDFPTDERKTPGSTELTNTKIGEDLRS